MDLPLGFAENKGNKVCKLTKSLHVLKQASRQWNIKLTTALLTHDLFKVIWTTLYSQQKVGQKLVIILVYVDDLMITENDDTLIQDTKNILQTCFKIKDLRNLKFFLGIEFDRKKDGILIHQRKYVVELISDIGFTGAKPFQTPLEVNKKLISLEFDQYVQDNTNQPLSDPSEYQSLIGRLL